MEILPFFHNTTQYSVADPGTHAMNPVEFIRILQKRREGIRKSIVAAWASKLRDRPHAFSSCPPHSITRWHLKISLAADLYSDCVFSQNPSVPFQVQRKSPPSCPAPNGREEKSRKRVFPASLSSINQVQMTQVLSEPMNPSTSSRSTISSARESTLRPLVFRCSSGASGAS